MDQKMQKKCLLAGLVLSTFLISNAAHVHAASWSVDQIRQLLNFNEKSHEDALPVLDAREVVGALEAGQGPSLDEAASALALRLARMHLLGTATAEQRAGWRIVDGDGEIDVGAWLERALAADALPTFLTAVRPDHPDYAALREAYAKETDPERRLTLARNMERWRWLPRSLGRDYILVNVAFFEARLWRDDRHAGTWPVIVGKTSTPTPVFSATVTGVNLNPWWNIPASIVREKGGRFSSRQGYVRSGGQWRQRPGPNNALGQMKLVMPNPYNVYMHDTPAKALFARETRAYSHGCIRTGDALGFAATLLQGARSRAEVDAIVRSLKTVTIDLPRPIPVYITYFTAAPMPDGTVAIRPDIYRRDGRIGGRANANVPCGV